MSIDQRACAEEAELDEILKAILTSDRPKKLVVAGPGTGKTTLFKVMLRGLSGAPDNRIVLTFINNLKDDLARDLVDLAKVFTLHSFCLGLLHWKEELRGSLSQRFRCCPGLASLIAKDWELIEGSRAPQFVDEMRNLDEDTHIPFYLERGNYYDAVDFDDSVYRVLDGLKAARASLDCYDLVLIDEYQDFNALEAGFIDILSSHNRIMIVGDDDQALYSKMRCASWDHIRLLETAGDYEVFKLPYCMRCPEVIVKAVNDVITKARSLGKLEGRIDKPYKYFPPVKGADSERYQQIISVKTSVQRLNANYMGRYIKESIAGISQSEIEEAVRGGYPAALVIAGNPYRSQISSYLESEGLCIETRSETRPGLDRETGLSILKEDRDSNIGWRIILDADLPSFLKDAIKQTYNGKKALVSVIPADYLKSVLIEVGVHEPPVDSAEDGREKSPVETPLVQVTSF